MLTISSAVISTAIATLTAIAVAFTAIGSAVAQEYPSKDKTITLVVPFAAGGPTDRVARDFAVALAKPLGGDSGDREHRWRVGLDWCQQNRPR